MSDKEAAKRGIKPMGIFRGFQVAGCEPDEMGIGPVGRSRGCSRHRREDGRRRPLELNEAFASQVLYIRDKLGIPTIASTSMAGAISIGHPYGMSGARMTGHALIEGKRPRREVRRRHHVHRRRPGCCRPVRSRLRRPNDGFALQP